VIEPSGWAVRIRMTRMAQPDFHDQAPAYVLDALDPEDRWTYERHLDECERCREEVAALREIAGELAFAAEGPAPPPQLRERILSAARSEPRTATVVPLRRRWLFPATAVAAVAAACAAIGLGLWANSLRGGPTEQRVVPVQGAAGNLIVADDRATLVVCLEQVPAGRTYEAWVIREDEPRPAGLFRGGCRSVPLEEPVRSGNVVAVTLERAGGSEKPTGDILASANV
jgi:anti-sigma-K factor RskA